MAAIRIGETPVPIPNTTVKPYAADGTSLETVRESRWPPEFKNTKAKERGRSRRETKKAEPGVRKPCR